jgi:hypothetical protein
MTCVFSFSHYSIKVLKRLTKWQHATGGEVGGGASLLPVQLLSAPHETTRPLLMFLIAFNM